jgi:hypothetical protein
MAAACNSMLDIIEVSIKFGALLDVLIRPMLAALAANPAHIPAAVIALHIIVFKIVLPVPKLIKICEILLGAFEAADDWKGEAPYLPVRIIRMAANAIPIELAEFVMRADAGIPVETAGQFFFAISCCILFRPTPFASGFKRVVLQQFGENVVAGQTNVYALDLFRISDHI